MASRACSTVQVVPPSVVDDCSGEVIDPPTAQQSSVSAHEIPSRNSMPGTCASGAQSAPPSVVEKTVPPPPLASPTAQQSNVPTQVIESRDPVLPGGESSDHVASRWSSRPLAAAASVARRRRARFSTRRPAEIAAPPLLFYKRSASSLGLSPQWWRSSTLSWSSWEEVSAQSRVSRPRRRPNWRSWCRSSPTCGCRRSVTMP